MGFREEQAARDALQNTIQQGTGDILSLFSEPLDPVKEIEPERVRNPLNFGSALGAFLQGPTMPAGRDLLQAQQRANEINAAVENRAIQINASRKERRDERDRERREQIARITTRANERLASLGLEGAIRGTELEHREQQRKDRLPRVPTAEQKSLEEHAKWASSPEGIQYEMQMKSLLETGAISQEVPMPGGGSMSLRKLLPGLDPTVNDGDGPTDEQKSFALAVLNDVYDQAISMISAVGTKWPQQQKEELAELEAIWQEKRAKLEIKTDGGDILPTESLFGRGLTASITDSLIKDEEPKEAGTEMLQHNIGLAIQAVDGALTGAIDAVFDPPEFDPTEQRPLIPQRAKDLFLGEEVPTEAGFPHLIRSLGAAVGIKPKPPGVDKQVQDSGSQ